MPKNVNPSGDQQKDIYGDSSDKNNRHSQYNQSGHKEKDEDAVLKIDHPEREITNIQAIV